MPITRIIIYLLAIVSGAAALAQPAPASPSADPEVQVTTHWSKTGLEPGGAIELAIVLDIPTPYHVNANTAKDEFFPASVTVVEAPKGMRTSTAIFPLPERIEFGEPPGATLIDVFSGKTAFYLSLAATDEAVPGTAKVQVQVNFQTCDNRQCFLQSTNVYTAVVQVLPAGAKAKPINAELFAPMATLKERLAIPLFGWDFAINPSQTWILLLVAALGGLLLNFTPCVLPLVPIKIMSLSRAAGDRRRCLFLGTTMAIGVVAFWLGLAVAISTISGFNATNKLFQYPAFTISVGFIICLMAVGMCGLFSVRLPQWIYGINPSQESAAGSFLFGIMTAVLSTPCTAPFMGAAAAWSATQPPFVTLSTFAAIGTGMAVPYLLLSAFPQLVQRLPRTGPASDLIKQLMGLLMLAAGAYFLGTGLAGIVATPPDPPTQIYWWAVAFFIATAGAWLTWRTFRITPKWSRRIFLGAAGVSLILAGGVVGIEFTKGSPIHWVYYTPERLAQAQSQKKVVVLEFTAAWCLNCRALESAVLHKPAIVTLLNSEDIIPIKVDLTGNNPRGSEKLVEVGRRSIPYLIVYSPAGETTFASDAYTVEQLIQAVQQVR